MRGHAAARFTPLLLGVAVAIAAAVSAAPARAQVGSGTVVLSTHLGGDSVQAALARLRRGATYRVAMVPATPLLQIRPPVRDTARTVPVTLRPLRPGDSVAGGTGGVFTTDRAGDFLIELTEAVPTTVFVEVTVVALAPGDILPRDGTARLVFSEIVSDAPSYVSLDSGVVYRITADGIVYLGPSGLSQAPVRIAPLVGGGGVGAPFIPALSGEYRLFGDSYAGPVAVRIYFDPADQRELSCVRDPSQRGCRGSGFMNRGQRARESFMVLTLSAIALLLFVQ